MRLFGRHMHPFRKALSRKASALAWDTLGYPTYIRQTACVDSSLYVEIYPKYLNRSSPITHTTVNDSYYYNFYLFIRYTGTSKFAHSIYTLRQRSGPTSIASIAIVAGQVSPVRHSLPLQAQRTEGPDVHEQRLQQQTEWRARCIPQPK